MPTEVADPVTSSGTATRSPDSGELGREVHEAIRRAFHRTADVDSANVGVVCQDGTVWLTGRVEGLGARAHAENAAWATPGVREVNNDITIGVPYRAGRGVTDSKP